MASRREEKERLRLEREAREEQEARRQRTRQRLTLIGAGGLVVLVVAGAVFALVSGGGTATSNSAGAGSGEGSGLGTPGALVEGPELPASQESDPQAAAAAADCELREDKDEGSEHLSTLAERASYGVNPPTSGPHFVQASEDASYTVAPQVESTVHALEHGRINLQWSQDASKTATGAIASIYAEDPYHVQAFQNQTEMPVEVAATAWNNALICESYNDRVPDAIRAFRDSYVDKGPEFVP